MSIENELSGITNGDDVKKAYNALNVGNVRREYERRAGGSRVVPQNDVIV